MQLIVLLCLPVIYTIAVPQKSDVKLEGLEFHDLSEVEDQKPLNKLDNLQQKRLPASYNELKTLTDDVTNKGVLGNDQYENGNILDNTVMDRTAIQMEKANENKQMSTSENAELFPRLDTIPQNIAVENKDFTTVQNNTEYKVNQEGSSTLMSTVNEKDNDNTKKGDGNSTYPENKELETNSPIKEVNVDENTDNRAVESSGRGQENSNNNDFDRSTDIIHLESNGKVTKGSITENEKDDDSSDKCNDKSFFSENKELGTNSQIKEVNLDENAINQDMESSGRGQENQNKFDYSTDITNLETNIPEDSSTDQNKYEVEENNSMTLFRQFLIPTTWPYIYRYNLYPIVYRTPTFSKVMFKRDLNSANIKQQEMPFYSQFPQSVAGSDLYGSYAIANTRPIGAFPISGPGFGESESEEIISESSEEE